MSNSISLKEPGWDLPSERYNGTGLESETDELNALDSSIHEEAGPPPDAKITAKVEKSTGMMQLFRKYASLSDLLRYAGAVSVAVAMAMFLIDGAAQFTDLQRFLTMLGFTGLLTAAGFIMSLLVKEQRGSRAFMMLSLLSVPVNFAVFGALLYSFIPLDGMMQSYPGFAHWQAGFGEIATALAAGLAVLVPIVWMSYTVLARPSRGWLTAGLLFSSAILVVPVRHELVIATLAVLSSGGLWWFVRSHGKESLVLKTAEGRFSVALLFLPPAILIARGLYLYEASSALVLMLTAATYIVLRQLLNSQKQGNFLSAVGAVAITAAALVLSTVVVEVVFLDLMHDPALIPGICIYLALCHDMLNVSPNKKLAGATGFLSVALSVCALVLFVMVSGTSLETAGCIVVLIAVAVYGYMNRRVWVTTVALAGVMAIGVMYIESLWGMALQTGWWGIAAAGAVAIVAGSLVDRAGTVVVEKPEVAR